MTTRARKTELTYRKHRKQKTDDQSCVFCKITPGHPEFIEGGKYFMVITASYGYSFWDEQDVEDQAMLVPKKHTTTISDLPLAAATEFLEFVSKYELQGYSVYARSPESATKSIPHQHTHLIKTKGKRKKFILFSRKPFVLIMR